MDTRPVTFPDLCIVGGLQLDAPGGHPSKSMAQAWRECGGRVLYAEIPADPWRSVSPAAMPDGLWRCGVEPSYWLPRTWPECWRRRQVAAGVRRIDRALDACGMRRASTAFLYCGWFWREMASLAGAAHVYDCIDDSAAFPHIARHEWMRRRVEAGEAAMVAAVQATLAVSPTLVDMHRHAATRIELAPNGVDLACWRTDATGALPESLAVLPRPRAVLFGNLQDKLDYALVAALAEAMPHVGFAIVGPLMAGVVLPAARQNLRWHDGVPQATLAGWMHGMDVALVPLRDTPFNRASCPLKVLEALGAGVPVVASRIPMTEYWQARFPDRIFLADDMAGWQAALSKACAAGRRALSTQEAQPLTWNARARQLAGIIHEVSRGAGA